MPQGNEERVIQFVLRRSVLQLGIHPFDRAEQHQRLIHQMTAQVTQHATTAGLADRTWRITLDAGLEPADRAQRLTVQQLAHGEEVRIPAAVLINAKQYATSLGRVHQLARLRCITGERLVADHPDTQFYRFEDQRSPRGQRCGNHHHINPGRNQLGQCVEGRHAGMVCGHFLLALG